MAGTITISKPIVLSRDASGRAISQEVVISWVADAADGSIPTLTTTDFSGWWLTKAVTNPGATAPTALYDITLVDADGLDLADGSLENRSATASEVETMAAQIGGGGFVVTLANNLVHSAVGILRLFMNR